MSKLVYVGIDNGISGGIAIISEHKGTMVDFCKMPTKKSRGGNEVDIRQFHLWLSNNIDNLSNATYIIEEPGGSLSAKAAKSMAGSFHSVRAFFETKFLRYERITPAKWQKQMIPSCATGETKARALARASEIWPDEKFILKGCRKPHDGIIDAALIAEWGRRNDI